MYKTKTVSKENAALATLVISLVFLFLGLSAYAALTNTIVHLWEGIILTGVLFYLDRRTRNAVTDDAEKTRFDNSMRYVDLPQLFGLVAILITYYFFSQFGSLTTSELEDFAAGAFAFNVMAANVTNVFAQL